MNSLTITLALIFIIVAISFSFLSSKTVHCIMRRYLKLNQPLEAFLFTIKKGTKGRIETIEQNNTFAIKTEDDSFSSSFKETFSEEAYLDTMKDKMKFYLRAEKYRSAGTLNQLKKLEEDWV